MAVFKALSAISVVNVNVGWYGQLDDVEQDPTKFVVKAAFPISSGNPLLPAQPVTWLAATWLTGTTGKWSIAQCKVGPSSGGGLVQLTAGQSYDVWSQLQAAGEQPAIFIGTLPVY
jgi:hypothetical protein